jgi:nuclear pore complex protein Nup107
MVNEDSELSLFAVSFTLGEVRIILNQQTLVEHLQSRPLLNAPPPLEARHGYLPSTVRRCKTEQLRGGTLTTPSIDPDFTLRDPQGQGLAGEDRTYQIPLLETLWDLVRHGELDQAVKVCEEGGEPWRGATMLGGRRWNMGGLSEYAILVVVPLLTVSEKFDASSDGGQSNQDAMEEVMSGYCQECQCKVLFAERP